MVNGTLIIQIIHFLIACVLIHTVILNYLVGIVMAERAQQANLEKAVDSTQQSITQLLEKKALFWQHIKRQFSLLMPRPKSDRASSFHEKAVPPVHLSERQLTDDRRNLSQFIVRKVTRVSSRTE